MKYTICTHHFKMPRVKRRVTRMDCQKELQWSRQQSELFAVGRANGMLLRNLMYHTAHFMNTVR